MFCINCGAKISQANENKETVDNPIDNKNVCPNCGSTLEPEAIFCVSCGKPLTSEAEHILQTRAATTKPNLIKQWNTKLESTNIVVNGKKFSLKIIALFGISILLMLGSYIVNPIQPKVSLQLFKKTVDEMENKYKFGGVSLRSGEENKTDNEQKTIYYESRDNDVILNIQLAQFEIERDAKMSYEEVHDLYEGRDDFDSEIDTSKKHSEQLEGVYESKGYNNKDVYVKLIRKDKYVLVIMYDEDVPEKDIKSLIKRIGMN